MPFLVDLVQHPRRLLLRRALFQVHLWLGILLSVYVALIGASGSVLVFEDELRSFSTRDLHSDPAHMAPAQAVLASVHSAFPGETPTYLMCPSPTLPAYTVYLATRGGGNRSVLADSASGKLLTGRPRLLVDTVHDFHVHLLMGQTGFIVNCSAGIGLLVLTLTGAVLWWPGLRLWMRGFRINLRASWKRIHYDTHNFVGIVTLLIVSWWGLTAIDFLWPTQVASAVALVSPLRGMKEPSVPAVQTAQLPERSGGQADPSVVPVLLPVLSRVGTLNPAGFLSGVALPATPDGNIVAYVDTRAPGDFSHRDIHTFSGRTGELLTTWHYGQNRTVGDWLLWLVYPLHFGTLWGLPVKVVWALLGLSLPVLSTTGLLMYWNRYLSKRWARLGSLT